MNSYFSDYHYSPEVTRGHFCNKINVQMLHMPLHFVYRLDCILGTVIIGILYFPLSFFAKISMLSGFLCSHSFPCVADLHAVCVSLGVCSQA